MNIFILSVVGLIGVMLFVAGLPFILPAWHAGMSVGLIVTALETGLGAMLGMIVFLLIEELSE